MSLGEEHNPYAAPQTELQVQSAPSRPAAFYPMSPRKAALMSILTLNLYDLAFWYRHWKRLKENGHDFSPIPRAIFAGFTSFRFVNLLNVERIARNLHSGEGLRSAPAIYLSLNVIARVSDRVLGGGTALAVSVIACAGCAWVLSTVQHGANEVLKADDYRGPSNSGVSAGTIFLGLFGLLLWIITIVGTLIPESFGE